MGKTVAAPGNYVTSEMPRKLNSFATVMQSSCSSLCKKFALLLLTSAARFFAVAAAGEPLLVLVSLSLSGVSLRLSGVSLRLSGLLA